MAQEIAARHTTKGLPCCQLLLHEFRCYAHLQHAPQFNLGIWFEVVRQRTEAPGRRVHDVQKRSVPSHFLFYQRTVEFVQRS